MPYFIYDMGSELLCYIRLWVLNSGLYLNVRPKETEQEEHKGKQRNEFELKHGIFSRTYADIPQF